MTHVVIIDSGGANLASLQFALERLDARSTVTDDATIIRSAQRVILPGVGAARDAMQRLRAAKLDKVLPELTQPVLGICLGMQLMFDASEEGGSACLGIFPGTIHRLTAAPGRPVPHMGWNALKCKQHDALLEGISDDDYVYFVHSYAAPLADTTLAVAEYGAEVPAIVRRRNFWGTQFHPERSGRVGARLLSNFLRLS